MTVRRIADLCCCEGGATAGYQAAGFRVKGIDVVRYPNYPGEEFELVDAIEWLVRHRDEFDAYVGSPPCHKHTTLNAYNQLEYADLIVPMRLCFDALGKPWVIENVPGAPLIDPVTLCGVDFGLKVYRHRLFETGGGFTFQAPRVCRGTRAEHRWLCSRNGYLPTEERPFMSVHGGQHSMAWQRAAAMALGLPHLVAPEGTKGDDRKRTIRAVCEAIPAAYTEYIGTALMEHLDAMETAA